MGRKLVFGHVFTPHDSLFKSVRNHKAKAFSIYCEASDRCFWYSQGACLCQGLLGHCPHGYQRQEDGYTRKAQKYSKWVHAKREALKDVPGAKTPAPMMAVVGDYVHLPYSHMAMNKNVPFRKHSALFVSGSPFVRKDEFTLEVVLSLVDFVPRTSLEGLPIAAYQRDEVPKFLAHLSTQMPEMYEALCDARPALRAKGTNVGRKALLRTLRPNVGTFRESGDWTWDGTYLTSVNADTWVRIVNKFSEIRIVPDPESVVAVTDDAQVTPETVFVS